MTYNVSRNANTLAKYVHIKKDQANDIIECYDRARALTQHRRDRWSEIYKMYHGYIKDRNRSKGRANFHWHKMFPAIETEAARFVLSYFSHTPYTTVIPTNGTSVDASKVMENSIQYYYEHCPVHFMSTLRLIKNTGLYGIGFRIPSWKTKTAKIKRTVPITMYNVQVGVEEIETEEVIYDGLWFDTYSPGQVFVDPYALDLESARYVIVEEWVPAEELLEKAKQGIYDLDKVNKIPMNASGQNEMEYIQRMEALGHPSPEADRGMVRLQHKLADDHFVTLANGVTIIRDTNNFYDHKKKPIIRGVKSLDPESFYPIGTGSVILPNQKMRNVFGNSMIDRVISSYHHMWKYKGSTVDPAQLLSVPNNRIRVQHMDDVEIIQAPEMKRDMLVVQELLDVNQEESIGYFGTQKGAAMGPAQTATSDSIFNEQGDKRITYDVMVFENGTLLPESKMVAALIAQFMPDETELRVNGPGGFSFQKINKQDIRGEYDFRAGGASESMNKAVAQQQMINLYNIASQATQYVKMPTGQMIPVPVLDTWNALKDIYEGAGVKDVDKILYRPEIFGIPINNETLNQFGLPSIPGLDNLQPNPKTGALTNPNNLPRSVDSKQIINNANNKNRVNPVGIL